MEDMAARDAIKIERETEKYSGFPLPPALQSHTRDSH